MRNKYKNIDRLKTIANALLPVKNKIVFIGGAVVDLYTDDPAREEVRITDDIDIVVEVINRGDYSELEEQVRILGFRNDTSSGVICRYKFNEIIVDIMPNDASVLGFSNKWYKDGVENSINFNIDTKTSIYLFPISYFIASKLEALKSRGNSSDYRGDSDFEDIIYIFNNRSTIENDILLADESVKIYIKFELEMLLKRHSIEEEITSNLEYSNNQFRKDRIISIWKNIINKLS
ncbi:hypothetical protein [Emticicia fontis]